MLFPTLTFAVFFLLVFPVCWLLRWRHWAWKLFVLFASYVFYGFWDSRFVLLLFTSSVVNYVIARRLVRPVVAENAPARGRAARLPSWLRGRRLLLTVALVFNLGILGLFKYYGFFLKSLSASLGAMGLPGHLPFVEVIVPVGISFFTFQAISYVVDIYRGKLVPGRWLDFAVYLAFFPHLVAGPIVRASEFMPQLDAPRVLPQRDATRGLRARRPRAVQEGGHLQLRRHGHRRSGVRRPGAAQLGGDPGGHLRLRRADLRRLQRLHGHRHRRRPVAGH